MQARGSAQRNIYYPDVLGMLSAGARLNTEAVQAAMGIYPKQMAVGQSFEILLILQNIYDQKVEGTVTVQLPKKDAAGNRLLIFTAQETIPVTLGPGEVGLLHIPITPQVGTPPGENYPLSVLLEFHRPRGRVMRDLSGGRVPGLVPLSPMRLNILRNEVGFGANSRTANTRVLNTLNGAFSVIPGVVLNKTENRTPRLESLWDASRLAEDERLYATVEQRTLQIANTVSRTQMYEPVIDETERRFQLIRFPLLPGEAILIAKCVTYVLEDGLQVEPGFSLTAGRWFQRLAAFIDDPDTLNNPTRLTRALYLAALHDAVRVAYFMLSRAVKDPVGAPDEHAAQASRIADALDGRLPMSLSLLYMPLVLGGLMLHDAIRTPVEKPWQTLEAAREAYRKRTNVGGIALPALVNKYFEPFADNAEESLIRSRVPRT